MREPKCVGLAVLAVLASSALTASAASAVEYKSESTSGNTFIGATSEGSHVFKAGATVSCSEAIAESEFAGTTSPTKDTGGIQYGKCTVAGQSATIATNGCTFLFGELTGTASPFGVPSIKIACPEGKSIVVTAITAGCTIKFGPQSTTGSTTATVSTGSPKTVTFAVNVSNVAYTGSGGICGGSGTNGTYTGKFLAKAFSDSSHKNQVGFLIGER